MTTYVAVQKRVRRKSHKNMNIRKKLITQGK